VSILGRHEAGRQAERRAVKSNRRGEGVLEKVDGRVIWNEMRDGFDVKAAVIATKTIENGKEGISSSLTGIPSKILEKTTHLDSHVAPIFSMYLL
jgi:hypothetical protein